jgi:tetratricopeptide (TPR) repeat protein
MRKLFTILIVTITAISCGKIKDAHNTLNDIETFINERPDSALTILDSFDTSLLDHKSVWAHHSLLHAQAKDKCYIDETDDSLMTQVVNYYEGKRDKEKLFKSYYYLGRIQYNAGDYAASMLSYTKAEHMINDIDDNLSKGLLFAQLGLLNQDYKDYSKALEAYQAAYICYEQAGMIKHLMQAKYSIAGIYREMKLYDESEQLFTEVMDWSFNNNLIYLCQLCVNSLITMYDEIDNRNKSADLVSSKYASLFANSIHIIRAKALELAFNGDHNAIEIMHKDVDRLAISLKDTLNNRYYMARIYKLLGKHQEAMSEQQFLYHIQDSLLTISLKYPLLSVKNKYLKSEYENAQLRIKANRTKLSFMCVFIVVVLILVTFIYRNHIKAKDFEISRYVEVADDLERSLIRKRKELEKMAKEAGQTDKQLKESAAFISNMFSKQYELLNKLTSTYYETHGCNKDKEAIYKYVSREIESLSSDKKAIQQLEDLVNLYRGNIMALIRQELPSLTEMEFRLLCYFCAGFSAKAISIFTGDTTNNIYVKKSRIKDEIQKLDAKIAEQILGVISSK